MTLDSGERQVAPSLDGIRRDHVERYAWLAAALPAASQVLDVGCGCGYGSHLLAEAGHHVTALDADAETIDYAMRHWRHPRVDFSRADLVDDRLDLTGHRTEVAACFEVIEHLADPEPLLRRLAGAADWLAVSVPNERVFPFRGFAFHHRHYTKEDLAGLLDRTGWSVTDWLGQAGPESGVEPGMEGRTLIAVAQTRSVRAVRPPHRSVAILGLGPSISAWLDLAKRLGGRGPLADQVWAINALGDVLACDLVFHMDDIRIQEARAAVAPGGNIAPMVGWLRRHPGPVMTSRAHPDYPGLVEFPLEDAIREFGFQYFNSTAAYAVCYAIMQGFKQIKLFGIDFTYPDAHHAERGRGCVEFWLGLAAARGIEITIAGGSSLMDANAGQGERFYGYDTLDLAISTGARGELVLTRTPKAEVPTVAEIEERYDHGRHPAGALADAA